MKVTLDDIRQKFDALCSGEESREAIADFASRARLQQEIEDEFRRGSVFFEPNLVVIPSVTRQNMEKAIEFLIQSGGVNSLSPE